MNTDSTQGILIAIDGPNGVGKTTLVESVRCLLRDAACEVLTTGEPTDSALGRWIRANHGEVRGNALACLVAANRYEHLEDVIQPALARNVIVLTDRYVMSSFVYQVMDGVSPEFVWALNSRCRPADLSICLSARRSSIAKRMSERPTLTRFEASASPEEEGQLYRQACELLRGNGWSVETTANKDGHADQIALEVAERILHMRAGGNV
ncbi:MAG: dTMP kinase [Desulfobacterales bacterium]|nr:dTMP kinase [Desulfobacterales bacterium]